MQSLEIALTLAAIFAAVAVARRARLGAAPEVWLTGPGRAWAWLAGSSLRSVLATVAFALLLRLALLPWAGVPLPIIHDEFSLLLQAQTFRLGRLANPTPAFAEHFETFHVNLWPAYQSVFFPGRSAALLLGDVLGHPWIGVLLVFAAFCGAVTWAIRGLLPGGIALGAGLLMAWRFGAFSYWVNSYWGGALTAFGGALVVGAALRLGRADWQFGAARAAALGLVFGLGLLLLMTSRPFEGFLLCLPIGVAIIFRVAHEALAGRSGLVLAAFVPATACLFVGIGLLGAYDVATTGRATYTPYELNRQTYALAPAFLSSPPLDGAKRGDPAMRAFYDWETDAHRRRGSASALARAMAAKLRGLWSFYVGPALTLPLLLGMALLARSRASLVLGGVLVLLGVLVATWDLPHYAAPAQILVALAAAVGLHGLWRARRAWTRPLAVGLVAASTLSALWPMVSLVSAGGPEGLPALTFFRPCCWFGPPADEGRPLYEARLRQIEGRHLVLVRTKPGDPLHEGWIWNGPDIESAPIVWARSLGPDHDAALAASMPDRKVWWLGDVSAQTDQPLERWLGQSDVSHSPS